MGTLCSEVCAPIRTSALLVPKYSGCQSFKLLHPGPTPSFDAGSAGANFMSPAPGAHCPRFSCHRSTAAGQCSLLVTTCTHVSCKHSPAHGRSASPHFPFVSRPEDFRVLGLGCIVYVGLSACDKATAAGAPPTMPNWRLPAPCSLPSIVLLPASSKSLLLSHMNMHAVSFSARPMPLLAVMIESPSPPPRTIRLDYVSRRRRWRGARGRRGCCLARTTKKTHQGTKTSQASTFTGAGGGGGIHGIPLQAGNA